MAGAPPALDARTEPAHENAIFAKLPRVVKSVTPRAPDHQTGIAEVRAARVRVKLPTLMRVAVVLQMTLVSELAGSEPQVDLLRGSACVKHLLDMLPRKLFGCAVS